jgi:hypothetical protein
VIDEGRGSPKHVPEFIHHLFPLVKMYWSPSVLKCWVPPLGQFLIDVIRNPRPIYPPDGALVAASGALTDPVDDEEVGLVRQDKTLEKSGPDNK